LEAIPTRLNIYFEGTLAQHFNSEELVALRTVRGKILQLHAALITEGVLTSITSTFILKALGTRG